MLPEPALYTEYTFTLPQGYVDPTGTLHRHGRMRLATAADEVEPLADDRVRANAAYLGILLLSRVVVQLGTLEGVTPQLVESLFAADFVFLQDLYIRINDARLPPPEMECPHCGSHFAHAGLEG
jgi:hypothetical protein